MVRGVVGSLLQTRYTPSSSATLTTTSLYDPEEEFQEMGTDGFFRRLNPAWQKTLGYTEATLFKRPFIELSVAKLSWRPSIP